MSLTTDSDTKASETGEPPVSSGFGLPMGIFVVVSSMIGVGVLTTSGFTVASVGSNQLTLCLWVVGGILALCGALCVAELAAALPSSGGDYIYLYEAYGSLAAFLSGWVSFLIGFAAPIAASAFASASYLLAPLGLPHTTASLARQVLASLAIVAFALSHTSKASHATRAHSTVTLLNLGFLCTFLVAGLYAGWDAGKIWPTGRRWTSAPPRRCSSPWFISPTRIRDGTLHRTSQARSPSRVDGCRRPS